jgi:hypothetical protein
MMLKDNFLDINKYVRKGAKAVGDRHVTAVDEA